MSRPPTTLPGHLSARKHLYLLLGSSSPPLQAPFIVAHVLLLSLCFGINTDVTPQQVTMSPQPATTATAGATAAATTDHGLWSQNVLQLNASKLVQILSNQVVSLKTVLHMPRECSGQAWHCCVQIGDLEWVTRPLCALVP